MENIEKSFYGYLKILTENSNIEFNKRFDEKKMKFNQEWLIGNFQTSYSLMINKARQTGSTNMLLAYALANSDKKVLFISDKEYMNNEIKIKLKSKKIEYYNITFKSFNSDYVGVEPNNDIIIIDEAGFHKNLKEFLSNLKEWKMLKEGGQMILISTPIGKDFQELFLKTHINGFAKIYLYHNLNEENVKLLKSNLGEEDFKNEYLNEFKEEKINKDFTIPAVRVEEEIYNKLLEKIEKLKFERNHGVKMTDYLREILIKDLNNL